MTNKICTSIEQCQKLIEVGINVNTADMYYPNRVGSNNYPLSIECKRGLPLLSQEFPAWSLSALMNLLPSELTEVGKYSTTIYKIDIRKYKLTDEVNLHQIAYGNYKWHEDGGYTWSNMINTGEKEDLLDAAFEMVYWLKENGKI